MEQTTPNPVPAQEPPTEHHPPAAGLPLPPPSGGHSVRRLALVGALLAVPAVFVFGILPRSRQQDALTAEAQARDARAALVDIVSAHYASDSDLSLPGNIQAITDTPLYARAGG